MTVAERFARHVCAMQYEDLSPDAVAACKVFLLDSLGVGVAGAGLPDAIRLREVGAAHATTMWLRCCAS